MNLYNQKYKLIGFVANGGIKANVMVFSTGRVIKVCLNKLVKSDIADDLNRHEMKEVHRKLFISNDTVTSYDISDRKESYWIVYAILSLLLVSVFVLSNITGIKPVEFESINAVVPAAIFFYPLTFIIIDTLNEFYGLKLTRISILSTLVVSIIFVFLLYFSTSLPAVGNWGLNDSFNEMMNGVVSVILASLVSYFVSENLNSILLQKIKKMTNSKYLFIRVILSTLIASLIDSILFVIIAFYGVFSNDLIITMITTQFIIKLFYAIFGVIPIYITRFAFNKYIIGEV